VGQPRRQLAVQIQPLGIEGAYQITPVRHADDRGEFLEWFRADRLAEHAGDGATTWAQANLSTSRAGVVRGAHFTVVPPGQSKYVVCVRGAVLDVIVDVRLGSPTYGQWTGVRLDDTEHRAVYFGPGLAHAFGAITDGATVVYLCAQPFVAATERGLNPLDPGLAIAWPFERPILSDRDASAPTLAELASQGQLPTYEQCLSAAATSPTRPG
jgi:dTDP-4-dehydrorhamnose 3,5-epimerase